MSPDDTLPPSSSGLGAMLVDDVDEELQAATQHGLLSASAFLPEVPVARDTIPSPPPSHEEDDAEVHRYALDAADLDED